MEELKQHTTEQVTKLKVTNDAPYMWPNLQKGTFLHAGDIKSDLQHWYGFFISQTVAK